LAATGTQEVAYLSTTDTTSRKEKISYFLLELPRHKRQSAYTKSTGKLWDYLNELHTGARIRTCPTENRLIQIYIAIPDFNIVTAIRIGTYPGLVMNWCALATEIR
jgi:hypothetical protein